MFVDIDSTIALVIYVRNMWEVSMEGSHNILHYGGVGGAAAVAVEAVSIEPHG
jgi:hypothetical protein